MTRCAPFFSRLRICLTILSVLMLLAGTWAQAAMPVTGPLTALVICSEGHEKTVWLDAAGEEHPAPHDCCDCTACHAATADALPQVQSLFLPVVWQRGAAPAAVETTLPLHPKGLPLSRGPPLFNPRNPLASVPAMAGIPRESARPQIVTPECLCGLRGARTIPA